MMFPAAARSNWTSWRKLRWLLTAVICLFMVAGLHAISVRGYRSKRSGSYSRILAQLHPTQMVTTVVAPKNDNALRSEVVKEMMKFAWENYVKYAFGSNELQPLSRSGFHGTALLGSGKLGVTIVDSIDTLHLMGLQDGVVRATNWIANHYDIRNTTEVSVFEANIRLLGGLLSIHALTQNNVFLRKAIDTANVLILALDTPTGLPFTTLDVNSGVGEAGTCISLAEAGTLHLEFVYLSAITGNPVYAKKVNRVRSLLANSRLQNGLYPNSVDFNDPKGAPCPLGFSVSIGGNADSFYEYLFKAYLLSDKQDRVAEELFVQAAHSLEGNLLYTSSAGLEFFAMLTASGHLEYRVEHLACFIGGLYALYSQYAREDDKTRLVQLAQNLTATCRSSYANTVTKLGPESFVFDNMAGQPTPEFSTRFYILRPEVVESYFYLWKLTGNEMYRDWAWDVVLALNKICRTQNGFTGIRDVNSARPNPDNVQQSFFMAETLKYLYLTFLDDDILPLNAWVFNTEAHPLPVIGSEPFQKAYLTWNGVPYQPIKG